MNRMALKNMMISEQLDERFGDHRSPVARCAWCGLPGGDGPPPWLLASRAGKEAIGAWGPLDLHEWLIKRGRASDHIVFSPVNVVLAHHSCHIEHGQTKAFALKCLRHKEELGYSPNEWLDEIFNAGEIKVHPGKIT